MELAITKKQQAFISASANEVLFGGAAGGGKSYAQLIDALIYALKYPKSKQLLLRRTFPDLERSLVLTHLTFYPLKRYKYNSSTHRGTFFNGSTIEFGYCDNEKDVFRYQGAEYDTIRFDELTHFTEQQYIYLISRLRGANSYPKQIKSSTNPGGVGHQWVKSRFIDIGEPNTEHQVKHGTRLFIPSKVDDNLFLMANDPTYKARLENLSENDKRALLYGDWDIFDGQYFGEWRREIHVIEPFKIPEHWRRYFAMDYGLDMLAAYWIAVDEQGRAYVYKEFCEGMDMGSGHSGLIVSDAIQAIKAHTTEKIYSYIAPPDLWNRKSDTGKSTAERFAESGIYLQKAQNDRAMGWMELKEWLKPCMDEHGNTIANLRVFSNCINLIKWIPALQYDPKNPDDCATQPHEITHGPDAIRYFVAGRPMAERQQPPEENSYTQQVYDFLNYGG